MRSCCVAQVSLNQATWFLVIIQPPIPTVDFSAQASAAARHISGEGRARGLCGAKARHWLSQSTLLA